MLPNEFTFLEAAKLVGELYETVTNFLAFPAGLRGRVVDFKWDPPHELIIEWEPTDNNLRFGTLMFSKAMVSRYLRRVETQNVENADEYTEAEARALVGRKFRQRVNFSLLPRETQGTIVDFARRKDGSAVVIVEWMVPNRTEPSLSWFTKGQIRRYGHISPQTE